MTGASFRRPAKAAAAAMPASMPAKACSQAASSANRRERSQVKRGSSWERSFRVSGMGVPPFGLICVEYYTPAGRFRQTGAFHYPKAKRALLCGRALVVYVVMLPRFVLYFLSNFLAPLHFHFPLQYLFGCPDKPTGYCTRPRLLLQYYLHNPQAVLLLFAVPL